MNEEALMRHRSHLPAQDRQARASLRKLLARNRPLVTGSLVQTERRCGKPGCKCTRGQKHQALYLGTRVGRQRKMIFVPREMHDDVRHWVQDAREIQRLIDVLSQTWLAQLDQRKQRRKDQRK
jgi:hypothetical protein